MLEFIYLFITTILVIVDQLAKYVALIKLKPIHTTTFLNGFMDFTFVENRGAAFGILSGKIWFFIIVTIIISILIIYSFFKLPKQKEYNFLKISLMLILSGALGNLIDRIFRGYVIDFFEFTFIEWPVFNIADIYVVVGTLIFSYVVLFVIKEEPDFMNFRKKN